MSPRDIEYGYNQIVGRVLNRLQKLPWIFELFAIGVLALFVYLSYSSWTQAYPGWSRFEIPQKLLWIVIVVASVSWLSRWIPQKLRGFYFFTASCSGWIFNAWKFEQNHLSLFLMPLMLLLGFLTFILKRYAQNKKQKWLLAFGFLTLNFVLIFLFGQLAMQHQNYESFTLYWLAHPEYYWFFILYWIFLGSTDAQSSRATLALHPINVFNPLPLPPESELLENDSVATRNWWRGVLDIAQALFMYSLAMYWLKSDILNEIWAQANSAPNWIVFRNWTTAIYFMVVVTASMNVVSGVLRLYRVKVPDTTNFLLLSQTPLEVWQRGSCHLYHMTMRLIFIPLSSRFRSVKAGLLGVAVFMFINLFLLHDVVLRNLFKIFIPGLPVGLLEFKQVFFQASIWVGGWFALFVIYSFFAKSPFFRKPIIQWFSVVLTTFLVGNIADISFTIFKAIEALIHF